MTETVHPGRVLAAELATRGWSQTDLTFVLGCSPKVVNLLVNEKQGVSPSMSKALGQALGLPLDHFAALQRAYELAMAGEPEAGITARATMLRTYPIRDMVRRGWLRSAATDDLGNQLARFFETDSADSVPYLAHAARKTGYEEREVPPAQLAWLFRVRQIARSMAVPRYSQTAFAEAVERMKGLLAAPEEARHVPRILSECGVRFMIVETLPQSKIDGVCMWLDAKSPVIALSTRFDRIDNFWFVLRHECEHVLQGHGRRVPEGMVDADLPTGTGEAAPGVPEEERIANAAAADFCVPQEKMISFILRKNPFFYEKDVLAFAKINGVHPGLPVGQIQRKTGRFDYLRKHQVKIREFVLPGAIVDGWDRPFNIE
ncbi:MAG: XRE family transcriptional regulator [Roseomonas sp.]|nr:XRE family transcriptional regulator [Roseomonas sp.]